MEDEAVHLSSGSRSANDKKPSVCAKREGQMRLNRVLIALRS